MTARARRAAASALLVIAFSSMGMSIAGEERPRYTGKPLSEVLRLLQSKGLRIVFTSAVVTPDLIVGAEPRTTSPRSQLEELLAPHGLESRDGPGGIIQIVRAKARAPAPVQAAGVSIEGRVIDAFTAAPIVTAAVRVDGGRAKSRTDAAGRFVVSGVPDGLHLLHASAADYEAVTHIVDVAAGLAADVVLQLIPTAGTHKEYVSVRGDPSHRGEPGVAAESALDRNQMQEFYGTLGDDPLRAVQALPRVTTVDDYHAEFAVRGTPFRQIEVVVDGVSTPWLRHSPIGRGASGSLAMFGSQVLEEATLRTGAYVRRYGEQLGPQLDVTLREGSRTDTQFRAGIGATSALLLGEGPLFGSPRGSWLVAGRRSLLEWPTEESDSGRTPFGFTDALAKLAYDVGAGHQVGVTFIGGTTAVDEEDNLAPADLAGGTAHASAISVSWRSRARSGLTLDQRAYLVTQGFKNTYQNGAIRDRGRSEEVVYRVSMTRPLSRGLVEAGGQVGRTRVEDVLSGTAWTRAGYAQLTWTPLRSLTFSPGVRLTGSTLTPKHAVSRWLLAEWALREGWRLTASAGVAHQLPELWYTLQPGTPADSATERSTHVDVALEQRLARSVRWQVTLFNRREADILREPDLTVRRVGDVLVSPDRRYLNALAGRSRGIELEVERRHANGLSGWVAYSYGKTQHTDIQRAETYPGDFDQRHALNVFGTYRIGAAGLGTTYRLGSNFPVPGYLAAAPDGTLFVGSARNQVRLPWYSRLDVRADYGVTYLGHQLTFFGEVWNVTNRSNIGLGRSFVTSTSQEAVGVTERPSRRRLFVGAFIEL